METNVRTSLDSDRIQTVWLDVAGKPVNTFGPETLAELAGAIASIEREKPAGVIFASAKARSFCAGADLFAIRKLDYVGVGKFIAEGQALFERISHLPMPTVAAINGDCLGGGLELALACDFRVAADDASVSIGLPEVKIGLIPAWGGTTRLPRLIGLKQSLSLLLAGKILPPRKAAKAGIVDEVVRPEALLAAAKRLLKKSADRPGTGVLNRLAVGFAPVRNLILDAANRRMLAQTHGHYPAPRKVIEVVRAGFGKPIDVGLSAERDAIASAIDTNAGRNLMRLFFLRQAAKKTAASKLSAKPRDISYAAVIGGGVMGAGIVHALIRAGIQVRLIEVDAKAASAGLGRIKKMLDDDVAIGRLNKLDAAGAMNRVSPAIECTGLHLADIVIEAVVEKMDVSREVFARLDQLTRPDAILASNTSSLPIGEMAAATAHPNRVIGLHFFNPVPKMPLAEVIRARQSNDQSLATAIAPATRIGKTPLLVNDAPGFLVNRVLIPYLAEALLLASEGVSITTIDHAMKDWGMPMGPFELLDEIGLDVAWHVLKSLSDQLSGTLPPTPVLQTAIERGWLGKKSGRGFYLYGKPGKKSAKPAPNAELIPASSTSAPMDEQSIQWRLILPMINEAAKLLEEHVTDSADDIDLATVLGLGFAPFRGGLMNFATTVGPETLVTKMNDLAAKYGPRFAPAELLKQRGSSHEPMAKPLSVPPIPPPPAPVGAVA